ncbi:hypothetical protein [Candidatus Chlorohelix sp.]|uniref:hypothetical protein n=1 Tax=Candidatus Chlorohelix sp. TaxID=3139201 RepID=UPI003072E56B
MALWERAIAFDGWWVNSGDWEGRIQIRGFGFWAFVGEMVLIRRGVARHALDGLYKSLGLWQSAIQNGNRDF